MNSPVLDILKSLVVFEKPSKTATYIQIAQQIIYAIQRGYLIQGTVLPGTRKFSELFAINRNTAVAIYEELASQGWVEIIPNKGTFIIMPEGSKGGIKGKAQGIENLKTYPKEAGFHFQSSFNLASTEAIPYNKFVINDGQTDLQLHPTHQFSRWYSAAMKRTSLITRWNQTQEHSHLNFNKQLCNYLITSRGFYITPKNVLSTRSTEMSLYIVSQLLLQKGDVVLVGDLSHYKSNMIFQQAGATIHTIPVDAYGIDVDYIARHFTKGSIRCVYVCANRQYPTTVTLIAERRVKLLQLAEIYGFAILEDDFDYDFQFEGSAMLPMASADAKGVVIYLGRFGQSFFPSFQIGFIVAPENIISEAQNYLQILDKQGDLVQKQMLTELISEGEIHRLNKKNITAYKKRRDLLNECLEVNFIDHAHWHLPSGGLAVWLRFQPAISLVQLAEEAKANDLFLPKTILYQSRNICAIRFGFGHLNEDFISIVVEKLRQSFEAIKK